jgi:MFS family permease
VTDKHDEQTNPENQTDLSATEPLPKHPTSNPISSPDVAYIGRGMGGGVPWAGLRTFESLKSPVFRLYYAAMLGQMAAMNMQMFARSFLVFELTSSYTILGVMALANAVPMLMFSLFGGVIADRVRKKHVLIVGQASSALITLVVAIALSMNLMSAEQPNSWLILVVASLFQGTVMGLMMPSRQAMIAEIVSSEQLMNAVALNTFGMNIFRILGPAIAGITVAMFGYDVVYYLMTAMYLVALFFILLMPLTGTMSIKGSSALRDVRDGLEYVKNERIIWTILIVTLLTVLFSMPYMMLLPGFAIDVLDVGESGGGLLMTVSGIGAMIGSLILASLPNKKRGLMLMGGSLLLGVALIGFSASTSFNISLVMMVFVGLGQTSRMTLGNTLLQYYVADEYRGRVMSLYFMEFGLTSFSVFFAAILAEKIGPQWAIGGLAVLLVILCIWVILFVPSIRKLD